MIRVARVLFSHFTRAMPITRERPLWLWTRNINWCKILTPTRDNLSRARLSPVGGSKTNSSVGFFASNTAIATRKLICRPNSQARLRPPPPPPEPVWGSPLSLAHCNSIAGACVRVLFVPNTRSIASCASQTAPNLPPCCSPVRCHILSPRANTLTKTP